jgi:hypothetical protein
MEFGLGNCSSSSSLNMGINPTESMVSSENKNLEPTIGTIAHHQKFVATNFLKLIRHETEITAHTPIILLGQASSPV